MVYPTITALMVTTGRLDLIKESYDCFAKQTYPEKKLLIVSDCDETTYNALKEYTQDNRVSILHFDTKMPLGKLRNLSLESSTSDLTIQWDDDDWSGPTRMMDQWGALKEGGAVLLTQQFHYFRDTGEVYLIEFKDGIEGTLLIDRRCGLKYPHKDRSEDTDLKTELMKRNLVNLVKDSFCYCGTYHTRNTWSRQHHKNRVMTGSSFLTKQQFSEFEKIYGQYLDFKGKFFISLQSNYCTSIYGKSIREIPTVKISCPVCNATATKQARTSADIVTCESCKITYLRTRPTVGTMERWHQTKVPSVNQMAFLQDEAVKMNKFRREYFFSEIESLYSRKGKLLDIGCGWGGFLHLAKERGMDVEGVEICKGAAHFVVNCLDIRVHCKQLEDCDFETGTFCTISLIHSLQQLPCQATALRTIHNLLEEGGILCGIVPNFNSFCSEFLQEKWPWLDLRCHYVHFTPATLSSVLKTYGFNVLKIYTATGDFPLNLLKESVAEKLKTSSVTEIERFISYLNDHHQGEEIRFFARRE